ncbi:MAG: ATP-binding protein [Phycisphaerae bacterium]
MNETPLAILLIEDSQADAMLLQAALSGTRERPSVVRAAMLADGLRLLRRRSFDLILLDLSLPDSYGMATVEKVLAAAASTPILVLTGLDDDRMGTEAVRKGAQDYLVKGKTGPDLLVKAIRYAIERKRSEQALRDSEERHRTILDEMREGIVYADARDTVRDINASACLLLETTREQVIGRPAVSIHPESMRDRVDAALRAFREGTGPDMVTMRRSLQDRELIVRLSPVRGPAKQYWGTITSLADITDQVRLQEQLAEARRLETLGRLAGGIAHEFNNLMATALGLASHLKRTCSPQNPEYPALTQIEQAAETAGTLAHQLLAYARGGRIRPRLAEFSAVVSRAVESFRPLLPPNVELDYRVTEPLGEVECDITQVEQVIVNLCRNAVEAMPQTGRLSIRAEHVRLDSPLEEANPPLAAGDYVCLAVEDTGCGMTPETLSHLFEPFFTTKPRGHGLGLASAWGIVRSHGGAISVATKPGSGSTFRVWLPCAPSLSTNGEETAPAASEAVAEPGWTA